MERFYYLHAEFDQDRDRHYHQYDREPGGPVRTTTKMQSPTTTCLSIFGKDSNSRTVVVRLLGYRIHFYVSFRDSRLAQYCCEWLAKNREEDLVVSITSVTGYNSMLIDKAHQTADKNEYADTSLCNVVRLQVRTRTSVKKTVEKIDQKVYEYYANQGTLEAYSSAARYYESNMDLITAATRNLGLDACCWRILDTERCRESDSAFYEGREYIFYDDGEQDPKSLFHKLSPTDPSSFLPPNVKIMSFDIECLSSDSETMPDATRDSIIQISTVTSIDALGRSTEIEEVVPPPDGPPCGLKHAFLRKLFTTGGDCSSIDGVDTLVCPDESALLKAFVDHVRTEDPDIMTGYNICTFDFPFVFKRIGVHRIDTTMGRRRRRATCKKRDEEIVRQYASFIPNTHDTHIPGRVVFDMYRYLRKEVVLRSYTLNSVSAHFLDKKKDDVSYKEIPSLFNGDADSRARLGKYCVKDSQLVLEIAFKTQTFVHAFERCKVFRTMLQYTVDRGQQVRFYSMLLAWCSERKILVDDVTTCRELQRNRVASADCEVLYAYGRRNEKQRNKRRKRAKVGDSGSKKIRLEEAGEQEESTDGEGGDSVYANATGTEPEVAARATGGKTKRAGYDGATVLDPITGMYYTPVICLDYASLYPSIMIGYNLCFTTFVKDKRCGKELALAGLAEVSPIGYYFLTRSVKKGVIPSILEMLLEERAEVRKRMVGLFDSSIEYKLLDGQQSALKMAANSIYGAIGCDKSILNFVEIPSSVTAYGRGLILQTKEYVEANYEATQVVYGDTDSVMVNLKQWDLPNRHVWECAAVGKDMAASVTRLIGRDPIRLQFETVYRPFLLCTKKRYAAGVYSNIDKLASMAVEEALKLCRPNIKYKGLQVVRRDNCTFSTRLMRFTLESLMDERGVSIERITDGLRVELKRLFEGHVNMKELVISKEWKKKGANAQAHDRLAQRMQLRDPNSAPSIGDRVPYVVVTALNQAKLCDRAEDPLYAMEKELQPDYMYYADNQVAKPIAELLRIAFRDQRPVEDVKDLFWPTDAPRRDTDKRRRAGEIGWTRKASIGSRRVTDYFEASSSSPSRCNSHEQRDEEMRLKRNALRCGLEKELADVEDVLDGLAQKCMSCKNNEIETIRSCRDRDCDTLYERFGNMKLRRQALNKLDLIVKASLGVQSSSSGINGSSTTGQNSNDYLSDEPHTRSLHHQHPAHSSRLYNIFLANQ